MHMHTYNIVKDIRETTATKTMQKRKLEAKTEAFDFYHLRIHFWTLHHIPLTYLYSVYWALNCR